MRARSAIVACLHKSSSRQGAQLIGKNTKRGPVCFEVILLANSAPGAPEDALHRDVQHEEICNQRNRVHNGRKCKHSKPMVYVRDIRRV